MSKTGGYLQESSSITFLGSICPSRFSLNTNFKGVFKNIILIASFP